MAFPGVIYPYDRKYQSTWPPADSGKVWAWMQAYPLFFQLPGEVEDRNRYVNGDTLAHEVFHMLGIWHTFETAQGLSDADKCALGSLVGDLELVRKGPYGCNEATDVPGCDTEVRPRNYHNVMSYGSCKFGERVSEGQLRRIRCIVEEHLTWLTPIATRRGPLPEAPVKTALRPQARPTAPPTPPSSRAPPEQAPPGFENGPCVGAAGTCIDTRSTACGHTPESRKCPRGGATILCCRDVRGRKRQSETQRRRQVLMAEAIDVPPSIVLHVGDELVVQLPAPLRAPTFFLYETGAMQHPLNDPVRPMPVTVPQNEDLVSRVTITLDFDAARVPVDRGDFAVVVRGAMADGEQVEFVSAVFAVDVNSCAIDETEYGAPYGLVRAEQACVSRQGTVARTLDDGMVCCASETTWRAVERPVWLEPPVDDMGLLVRDDGETPAAESELLLAYQQRGQTLFWGAAAELTILQAPNAPTSLTLSATLPQGSELPQYRLNINPSDARVAFAPPATNPGAYALVSAPTSDFFAAPFAVAPLPCRTTADDVAGYCLPTAAIAGGVGVATSPLFVTESTEFAPCAKLTALSVTFACQAGPTAFDQGTAIYRAQSANENGGDDSSDTIVVTTSAASAPTLFATALLSLSAALL